MACGLLVSCSASDDDGLEPPVADAEEIDTSPAIESEPPESEPGDPSDGDGDAQPIGDDEPLYAPLPELTPDPGNDIPDELERDVFAAYADAYEVAFEAYARGEADEERLAATHFDEALTSVQETVSSLADRGAVERSPDTTIDRVWITEAVGWIAIVRECYTTGPLTGQYDADSMELIHAAPSGQFAQDSMIEMVRLDGEDVPQFRVTQIAAAGTEQC